MNTEGKEALWEDPDMGIPKDPHEIQREPNPWEPAEETGLQIPTPSTDKKKDYNPWINPEQIPDDDEPKPEEHPTLH